jgi:hypothetical protein
VQITELVDQQFKIGNVLKWLSIVISYGYKCMGFCPDSLFCIRNENVYYCQIFSYFFTCLGTSPQNH